MGAKIPVAVASGDGIGPEIMGATLHVLQAAGARLEFFPVEVGEKVYKRGVATGIEPATWDVLKRAKAFLKAPITTPQGGGFKSLNVTIRSTLGLFANLRPCLSYAPFVATKHPKMDLVVVRENEEDLYTGIEYRHSPQGYSAIKLLSRPGSERIIRYAFEYARHYGRKKVSCFTKDNILKLSDGMFHKVFEEIGQEYPDLEKEHWLIDIGAAKLADTPEIFDVLVLPNLYGDILSDVAAQISGSVGLVGSANIGSHGAMFEAIHGSAPKRAGQNVANPSALLLASVLMLNHLGEHATAERIHNGWLCALERGYHTYDIFSKEMSKEKVGTQEFAEVVVKCLGQKPTSLPAVSYADGSKYTYLPVQHKEVHSQRTLVGVDLFVYDPRAAEALIREATSREWTPLALVAIHNRGTQLYPEGHRETLCIDQWRLRFTAKKKQAEVSPAQILEVQQEALRRGFDCVKTENLYLFDGAPGF